MTYSHTEGSSITTNSNNGKSNVDYQPSASISLIRKNVSENDMLLLLPRTHFTPTEFKLLKQYFSSLSESLMLNIEQCKSLFFADQLKHEQFEFTEADQFVLDSIFKAINFDNDGYISFSEFVQALSIAIHGTFEEKAQFSFRIYDANGDGFISRDEMINYVRVLHRLGVLRLSSRLQTQVTRGDQEEIELKRMESNSRMSIFKENLPRTVFGVGELDIQHENAPDKYPVTTIPGALSLSSEQQSHVHGEEEVQQLQPQQQIASPDDHIYLSNSNIVAADNYSRIMQNETGTIPSVEEIQNLLIQFFGNETDLTYGKYVQRSMQEKYLVEGLGVYDYIFYPIWQPIHQFLSSPNPKEKCGFLKTNNTVYFAEIRDAYMFLLDPNDHSYKKKINIHKIDKVVFSSRNSFAIRVDNKWCDFEIPIGEKNTQDWVFCIMLYIIASKDNRYDSFAPVRSHVQACPLIDGEEALEAMAHAMLNAKEKIYIAGWCVSPHIYLVRDRSVKNLASYRLDHILHTVAKRGVKIYIILWHETTLAGMNLNTVLTSKLLTSMHPNIQVILHPPTTPFVWTHHQKSVVVDDLIGFCGGIDLAWGRYDNASHTIVDNCQLSLTWPGNDYYNGAVNRCVSCKSKIDSFRDGFDRDRHPRLPWHDIHCVVTGELARDLALNFVGRFNHHFGDVLSLKIHGPDDELLHPKAHHIAPYLPTWVNMVTVNGQVIRSISSWSGSMRTEQSIHNAYIEIIQQAQYYIYIENQYFCSHTILSYKNENLIAQAITERISRAIVEHEVFRVYILLPMHPDGDPLDSSIQQIIKYQNRTICGIYEQLKTRHPEADIDKYISFFSLCNYGYLQGMAHFNQIYIHSKLMIVDDKITIIGSANINDRSMNGSRDSEIAVVIEDLDVTQTFMNGRLRRTGKFAKSLRKRLWREHLGYNPKEATEKAQQQATVEATSPIAAAASVSLGGTSVSVTKSAMKEKLQHQRRMIDQQLNRSFNDPISDNVYNKLRRRATKNTKIYDQVFIHYPGAKHPTVADYKRSLEEFERLVDANLNGELTIRNPNEPMLAKIKGHLVEYPLMWLFRDPFKKDIKLKVLDTSVFY